MTPNKLLELSQPNLLKTSGIYMILCVVSNKAYIGKSTNIHRRWNHHRSDLKLNKHGNIYLQRTYNKHGLNSLVFFVLENCSNLAERESYYVSQIDEAYRLNLGAITKDHKMSDETKRKISEKLTGKKLSQETKDKISEAGKYRSKDTVEKIRLAAIGRPSAMKGKKFSNEHRAKLSQIMKDWYAKKKTI